MKESELLKKINSISSHLRKTKLVENAYELARTKGEGRTDVRNCHAKLNYNFNKEDLRIIINDGWSEMGGGEIKVFNETELVLYGDRNSSDKRENKFNPVIDGFCILNYKAGDWEKNINKYLNQKEITKPVKPKEPEVSEETLEKLSKSLNIKFN